MNKKEVFLFLLSAFVFFACNDDNHCLTNYTENKYRYEFRIDSADLDSKKCTYYSTIMLCYDKNDRAFSSKMYIKDSIFYYKIIEKPQSDYFPLFDLTKKENYDVKINYLNSPDYEIQDKLHVRPIQVIKTNDNKLVFVFRVSGIYCYTGNKYDGTFFIDYERGIIGSYIYFKNEDDVEYMANPKGNIFENKIDYSKFRKVQLL